MILIYYSPGYQLGAKRTHHPLTGVTVELYAKHPTARRPRWQRLVSLTLPQAARDALADFIGGAPPYPESPDGTRRLP